MRLSTSCILRHLAIFTSSTTWCLGSPPPSVLPAAAVSVSSVTEGSSLRLMSFVRMWPTKGMKGTESDTTSSRVTSDRPSVPATSLIPFHFPGRRRSTRPHVACRRNTGVDSRTPMISTTPSKLSMCSNSASAVSTRWQMTSARDLGDSSFSTAFMRAVEARCTHALKAWKLGLRSGFLKLQFTHSASGMCAKNACAVRVICFATCAGEKRSRSGAGLDGEKRGRSGVAERVIGEPSRGVPAGPKEGHAGA
mmetsp:Transcript_6983/g.20415  ORF Transcript_6983/g.20415 Transcript_6983/m.20415 type:complete len:251 (-) Transcript_6983:898-1650(-)